MGKRLHLVLTFVWAVITPLLCWLIYVNPEGPFALVWITLVSHYANFVSHWGAYQGARAERAAQEGNQ